MIETVKSRVLELARELAQHHITLVTAESCTGGGLSYWLTSIPGSSAWFERGFVTYSDTAKIDMLGVNPNTIEKWGAVSEETAKEMAAGALAASKANIAVAITGIAGPEGGTHEKPVGSVWTAWLKQGMQVDACLQLFPGDRQTIRLHAIAYALERLISVVKKP